MKIKEMFNKAKEKATKVKTFITEHSTETVSGVSVLGAIVAGAVIHKVYDDAKYNSIRRADGFVATDDNGEEYRWFITVTPPVRSLKQKDDNVKTRLVEYKTREDYEEACELLNMEPIK